MSRAGFEEAGEPEVAQIHDWIARFNRPGAWPLATLPGPVLVGRIIAGVDDATRQWFAGRVHDALKKLVAPGAYLHHGDLEHWYGRFYPNAAPNLEFEDLFAQGETGGFVTVDRSTGLVSIDWDGPTLVCFFGRGLVSALDAHVDPGTGRISPFLEPM